MQIKKVNKNNKSKYYWYWCYRHNVKLRTVIKVGNKQFFNRTHSAVGEDLPMSKLRAQKPCLCFSLLIFLIIYEKCWAHIVIIVTVVTSPKK